VVDNPVELLDGGILRVRWKSGAGRVTPPVSDAVRFFESWGIAQPATDDSTDYTVKALRKIEPARQRAELRALNRIDPFAARVTARKLFGISLTQANEMLDALDDKDSTDRKQ
jgi:hypothetical protein